jgi:hypothetical protein
MLSPEILTNWKLEKKKNYIKQNIAFRTFRIIFLAGKEEIVRLWPENLTDVVNFRDLAVDESMTLKLVVLEKFDLRVVKPGKLYHTVKLLTCVRALTHSNLSWDTNYPETFIGIHIPSGRLPRYYLKSGHNRFIRITSNSPFTLMQSFDAIRREIQRAPLNNLQIQI